MPNLHPVVVISIWLHMLKLYLHLPTWVRDIIFYSIIVVGSSFTETLNHRSGKYINVNDYFYCGDEG